MPMYVLLTDACLYLAVCGALTLAGAGLIRLLRLPLTTGETLLLGPVVGQALWACLLASSVISLLPLKYAVLPIWGVTLALGAWGWRTLTRGPAGGDAAPPLRQAGALLALCVVLPAVTMWPYLGTGLRHYRGSGLPDGWSYVAFGQYLWDFARGTEGGLAPAYQYGAIFRYMRNIAASELGVLSAVAFPGETYSAAGLLQAVSLFTFLAACAAFVCSRPMSFAGRLFYLLLVGASGWLANLIWANNYDHGLALTYAPAIALVLGIPAGATIGYGVLLGTLVSALILTYPELVPLLLASGCLAGAARGLRSLPRDLWGRVGVAVLVCLIIVGPYLNEIRLYFLNQLLNGMQSAERPGEGMFAGLLLPRVQLAAIWALGAEQRVLRAALVQSLIAVALTALAAAGVTRWIRQRELGTVAALALMLAAAGVLLFVQSYSYGAYKALLSGWWLIALAVIAGWEWCRSLPRRGAGGLIFAAATAVCLAIPASSVARAILLPFHHALPPFTIYEEVQQVASRVDGQPLAIQVDDVAASYWAVYFLRHTPTRVDDFRGYLAAPHIRAALERGTAIAPEQIRFILTDGRGHDSAAAARGFSLVWESAAYRLWERPPGSAVGMREPTSRATWSLAAIARSLLVYLLACAALTFFGRAILRAVGPTLDPIVQLLIAPCAGLAGWAIVLGLGVLLDVPVKWLATPIWLMTAVAAVYGAYVWWSQDLPQPSGKEGWKPAVIWPLVALAVVVIARAPVFVYGLADYPGSRLMDGWAYVAYAQYLWELPTGRDGLSPLYQYGVVLYGARHVGSSQLALLSVLMTPGVAQSSAMLLHAVGLFCFASASLAFGRQRGLSGPTLLCYIVLVVVSGWTLNVIWANNNDNLIALAYFPALVALASTRDLLSPRNAAMVGLLSAAVLYTYPEFAAPILLSVAALVVEHVFRSGIRSSLAGLLVLACVFFAASGPYLVQATRFLLEQAETGMRTGAQRPGIGMFTGLVTAGSRLPALWALGAEHHFLPAHILQFPVALCLTLLLAIGIGRLIVQRDFALVTIAGGAAAGAFFFMFRDGYAYGTYKLILLAWWLTAYMLLAGASWCLAPGRRGRSGLAVVVAIVLMAVPGVALARVASETLTAPFSMARFRSVAGIASMISRQPVAVFVDDGEASIWSMYFLREHPVQMGMLRGYPASEGYAASVRRAPWRPWETFRYLLTDAVDPGPVVEAEGWKCLWKSDALALWDTQASGWAIVSDVQNPNGLDRTPAPWLWLGGGETRFTMIANRAGSATLSADFVPGPSLPPSHRERRLIVRSADGVEETTTVMPGRGEVDIRISGGEHVYSLRPLDAASIPVQPNGDTRPLVLGVREPTLSWSPPQ